MKSFKSINPFNQQVLGIYEQDSSEIIALKIAKGWDGHLKLRTKTVSFRENQLRNCAYKLFDRKDYLAQLISAEMGKVLSESISEIEKCILLCHFYADHSSSFLDRDNSKPVLPECENYVIFEPLGIVLGIMPWNFPFWQVFRFAIPALVAGNAVLLKHASNVSGCAVEIENIFVSAGFTNHEFQTLLLESSRIEEVISDFRVKAISLTGSEAAGRSVGALAGKYIKKTVMELGSNDAFIVLKDSNVEAAAHAACKSRLINNGQSCIAAKRFIIVEDVYDKFMSYFKKSLSNVTLGDPLAESTTLGPLARLDLKVELKNQIKLSVDMGAVVEKFGEDDDDNAFVAPTILYNPPKKSPAYEEELFGPVAVVFKVKNLTDAIDIANDSLYGLGASIWTFDKEAIEICKRELSVGSVFVNNIVISHPSMPFGGVNNSGFGRELGSYGIKEFVNVKSVFINLNHEN